MRKKKRKKKNEKKKYIMVKKKKYIRKKKYNNKMYKRQELVSFCKSFHIKGVSNLKKQDIIVKLKNHMISNMKKTSNDFKDPISLEPFEDWTVDELLQAVFVNNFFYQKDSIKQFVNRFYKENEEIKDPVNLSKTIPTSIVDKFYEKETNNFSFEISYVNASIQNYNFYFIFLTTNVKSIQTFLPFIADHSSYLIGVLPSDIDYTHPELKSLDLSTTSVALLYRIIQLYENRILIKKQNEGFYIEKIKHIQEIRSWFVNGVVETKLADCNYFKLIQEIEEKE